VVSASPGNTWPDTAIAGGDAKQFVASVNRVDAPEQQQDLIEGFFNEPDRGEDRAAWRRLQ
jgi:hypothetical protein